MAGAAEVAHHAHVVLERDGRGALGARDVRDPVLREEVGHPHPREERVVVLRVGRDVGERRHPALAARLRAEVLVQVAAQVLEAARERRLEVVGDVLQLEVAVAPAVRHLAAVRVLVGVRRGVEAAARVVGAVHVRVAEVAACALGG